MGVFDRIPGRWVVGCVGFVLFCFVFVLRVSISIAMVSMVNRTAGYSVQQDGNAPQEQCKHWNVSQGQAKVSVHEEGSFDWNEVIQGAVLSAFYYGYVVTQLPGGRLAEIFGPKRVIGYSFLMASLLALLIPAAANLHYGVLIFVRVLQGLAQGVLFPATTPLIAAWIPLQERSRFSALLYSGCMLGIVLCMWLSGTIIHHLGWEAVFYITGCVSVAVFVLWQLLVYDGPEEHPFISEQEKNYILSSLVMHKKSQEKLPVPWKSIWSSVPVWCLILCEIGNNWSLHCFNSTLPTYMKHILRFNVKTNGFVTGLPYLGRWLFGWFLAGMADFILARGWLRDINVRKVIHTISFIIPGILMAIIGYAGCDPWIVIALLVIAVSCNGGLYSGYMICHSFITPNFGGTTYGISNGFGAIPGFVAPTVVGALTNNQQTVEQWRKVFWIAACMYIITGLQFLVLASTDVQPWNDPEPKGKKIKRAQQDTKC